MHEYEKFVDIFFYYFGCTNDIFANYIDECCVDNYPVPLAWLEDKDTRTLYNLQDSKEIWWDTQ